MRAQWPSADHRGLLRWWGTMKERDKNALVTYTTCREVHYIAVSPVRPYMQKRLRKWKTCLLTQQQASEYPQGLWARAAVSYTAGAWTGLPLIRGLFSRLDDDSDTFRMTCFWVIIRELTRNVKNASDHHPAVGNIIATFIYSRHYSCISLPQKSMKSVVCGYSRCLRMCGLNMTSSSCLIDERTETHMVVNPIFFPSERAHRDTRESCVERTCHTGSRTSPDLRAAPAVLNKVECLLSQQPQQISAVNIPPFTFSGETPGFAASLNVRTSLPSTQDSTK